jgi:serine/threonine protein kinase
MLPDQILSKHTELTGVLLNERYEVLAELGRGGMGAVYRAHDTVLKREVAVKMLSEAHLDSKHRARLLREAQAVASLNHPNIVSVHDAGEHQDVPFIVMELVPGKSLDTLMPVTLDRAMTLSLDICRALEHAHSHGVIHRDIKPENVLITEPEGITKLLDFGLAYQDASRLTVKGEILGTLFYMAPEQITGDPVDARTDLYALGVLMYELVTGELPFSEDSPIALINHHLHSTAVPPHLKNPAIPLALSNLILSLMAKSPADRPQSAAQVITALRGLQSQPATQPRDQAQPGPGTVSPALSRDSAQDQIQAWKAEGQFTLDVTSLALLHRYPKEVTFDLEDLSLVFRSAMHLGMDLEPWMGRAGSSESALAALDEILLGYPKPEIRRQIVNTLIKVPDQRATEILLRLAQDDDNHQVRSLAAVEASRRGNRQAVITTLLEQIRSTNDPVALAALVAVADEVGLPEEAGTYPRWQMLYGLFQRRWQTQRKAIFDRAWHAGLGTGSFMLVLGLLTPLYSALLNPEIYEETLTVWPLPVWSLMGGVTTLVIGGLQSYISCLAVGTADMLWRGTNNRWGRYILGALSGLFFSLYEIVFIILTLLATPQVTGPMYIPLLILFGLILGMGLAAVIPPFYSPIRGGGRTWRVVGVAVLLTGIALPLYGFIYQGFIPVTIVFRLLFIFVLTIGAGYCTKGKMKEQAS